MTPQEFKAWFDGFTEALSGTPNKTQWERIKSRVSEINGTPVTYPVYVDRYWPNRWSTYTSAGGALGGQLNGGSYYSNNAGGNMAATRYTEMLAVGGTATTNADPFDGVAAMYAAGKADAEVISTS